MRASRRNRRPDEKAKAIVRFSTVLEGPVPEPATCALVGLGLAAVALLRARR
ncbi:MAG: PEP-CTERM sorting domain-containing protein [Myxococcota bacterium]